MRETSAQSPLFVKTYDFLLWLLPLTLKFPKAQRFLLAEWLRKMALDFYELLLEAVMESSDAMVKLDQADRMLTKIRLYVRLSYDLQRISPVLRGGNWNRNNNNPDNRNNIGVRCAAFPAP